MRGALFAAAALTATLAIPCAPAEAQDRMSAAASSDGGWSPDRDFRRGDGDGDRHRDRDRRRHRGDRTIFYGDRDYQGDTAWRHNSFNDWWHERPHRSYPAWMSRNEDCERLWWSGGGWRC